MQKFKGDDFENKMIACAQPIFDMLSGTKDDFYNGAYDCAVLGDLLHDGTRSPLSNAIKLEVFRTFFNTLYTNFTECGSFESYLAVFRKIFGDDVAVVFTVPAPGKLDIDITASDLIEDAFIGRTVGTDGWTYYSVLWWDATHDPGGDILFQTIKGFKTQQEVEGMLHEMIPAGIFPTITLTFA